MNFSIDPRDQQRFTAGLIRLSRFTGKPLLDYLRQLAVYYAQAARKRTPGPWYNAITKTMKQRPVRKLSPIEARAESAKAGKLKRYAVEVWTGRQPAKAPRWLPVRTDRSNLRRIKYRGAAQLSWSAMIRRLFKSEVLPSEVGGNFARVLQQGAAVQQGHEGNFRPFITTENRLGYIARIRPGIAQEALLSAENRFAAAYIRKMGDQMRQTWERGT